MTYDPLNPPWWHLRFWFYYRRARFLTRFEKTETCPDGCCIRWMRWGKEVGGINPVGVNHFSVEQ